MRVTRITIDAELGIIELRTGPGGDGDYVLLPLELSPMMQRYIKVPDDENAKQPKTDSGCIEMPGGWRVGPSDELVKAQAASLRVERGGIKYPATPHSEVCCPCGFCNRIGDN